MSSASRLRDTNTRLENSQDFQAPPSEIPCPGHQRDHTSLRTALLNFSSQWFLVPQGSGITAVVLHELEYQFSGLEIISYIIWIFTVISLALFLLIYLVRLMLFFTPTWTALWKDSTETACLSSVSIALTSVIQMMALVFGAQWGVAAVVMWWINLAIALPVSTILPYLFLRNQGPGIRGMPPVALLPMVAAITLAAGGGAVAGNAAVGIAVRLPIVLVSLLFLGLALPLALAFSSVYLSRLVEKSLPANGKVFQDFILCGPWGQGSYALQSLGLFLTENSGSVGGLTGAAISAEQASSMAGYAALLIGFVLWGHAAFWWFFAMVSVMQSWFWSRKRPESSEPRQQYTLCAWSLVFPWGVFTHAAIELGKTWGSAIFSIWATILASVLAALFLGNLVLTVYGLFRGSLLLDPSLRQGLASFRVDKSPQSCATLQGEIPLAA